MHNGAKLFLKYHFNFYILAISRVIFFRFHTVTRIPSEITDYRLTDAKVEPFYNEAEKMRNDK